MIDIIISCYHDLTKECEVQMTEGVVWKKIVGFAIPLLLGNLFQQLYNTVDSIVVGNFCGNDALAAVTSSGSLCHLFIGFFQGVFVGASVIIAHSYGAKDNEKVNKVIHTTIWFSVILGIVLSVLGVIFTPTLLHMMGTPENVMPNSVAYFKIYCAGLLGLVLYNTSNGIFQALGDSKHPLYYLIISSITNVILDLLLVGGFDMGVAGAALATIISQFFSAMLGFAYLMSGKFVVKVDIRKVLKPDFTLLKQVIGMGFPSGIQNSVTAIANVVVQSNINAFGEAAMAGCGSYMKIQGFVFLPIMSLSMALSTFISQNLGAKKIERVKKGTKEATVLAVILAQIFGIFMYFHAPIFVRLFSKETEVIAYGVQYSKIDSLFYFALALSHMGAAILRGSGRTKIPMMVFLLDWCVFRILYIIFMVRLIPDIRTVISAYPVTWFISAVIFMAIVLKGDWLKKKIL